MEYDFKRGLVFVMRVKEQISCEYYLTLRPLLISSSGECHTHDSSFPDVQYSIRSSLEGCAHVYTPLISHHVSIPAIQSLPGAALIPISRPCIVEPKAS